MSVSAPTFGDLADTIPIFPLVGVLLLPGAKLPLNIFEPRYLDMVRDAMTGSRLIGMVQPLDPATTDYEPEVYRTGCLGRITAFQETDDRRFLITLAGLCRMTIAEELPRRKRYREVRASYESAGGTGATAETLDRTRLISALRAFLVAQELSANWSAVESMAVNDLVTALAMVCPFDPIEKQALLEAPTSDERGRVMTALLEMGALQQRGGSAAAPQ